MKNLLNEFKTIPGTYSKESSRSNDPDYPMHLIESNKNPENKIDAYIDDEGVSIQLTVDIPIDKIDKYYDLIETIKSVWE